MGLEEKWEFLDYTCAECPHYKHRGYTDGSKTMYCEMTHKVFYYKWNIQDWCPKFTWFQKLIRRIYWWFHKTSRLLFS